MDGTVLSVALPLVPEGFPRNRRFNMLIDVVHRNVRVTQEQKEWIQRRIDFALSRFARRIRRVSLIFSDINGARGGVDKKCRIVVTLSPQGEIMIDETAVNIEAAVAVISDRVARAISRTLERRQDLHVPREQTIKSEYGSAAL
ncbi:MAG: HPF/RaiA family ribosome-associated protein [Planctomycetota bacterium]|nr:MAG: HPF/RaiA family ribosome-associated protein [Planctomycetota bacterium]